MVLARKANEWLARDEERVRQRVLAVVDAWLAEFGLPPVDEVLRKGPDAFTPDQLLAAAHVADVMTNKRCTDPDCPYRDHEVPDFIKG